MKLVALADRRAEALDNMLTDWLLLAARPEAQREAAYFRHYGWKGPTWTYGYGQNLAQILEEPGAREVTLQRRPTGGGIVDHRNDWTWSLVLPPSHPLFKVHLREVYPRLHHPLAAALTSCGGQVRAFQQEALAIGAPFKCFSEPQGADLADLMGQKAAGAALKKTRAGILVQGSVARASFPGLDWPVLTQILFGLLAEALGMETEISAPPDFSQESRNSLQKRLLRDLP